MYVTSWQIQEAGRFKKYVAQEQRAERHNLRASYIALCPLRQASSQSNKSSAIHYASPKSHNTLSQYVKFRGPKPVRPVFTTDRKRKK